jgi:uncharacterized protein YdhG (YjbR/CyaY superfamily)
MIQKPETARQRMSMCMLASVPAQERAVVDDLRRTIRAAAPLSKERTRYGMQGFFCHGPVVFFAAFKTTPGSMA